jgi:hypothetical protein
MTIPSPGVKVTVPLEAGKTNDGKNARAVVGFAVCLLVATIGGLLQPGLV